MAGTPDYIIERRMRHARKGKLSLKDIKKAELMKRCKLKGVAYMFMSEKKRKEVRASAMSKDLRRWLD